jgi:hypothetical protein
MGSLLEATDHGVVLANLKMVFNVTIVDGQKNRPLRHFRHVTGQASSTKAWSFWNGVRVSLSRNLQFNVQKLEKLTIN